MYRLEARIAPRDRSYVRQRPSGVKLPLGTTSARQRVRDYEMTSLRGDRLCPTCAGLLGSVPPSMREPDGPPRAERQRPMEVVSSDPRPRAPRRARRPPRPGQQLHPQDPGHQDLTALPGDASNRGSSRKPLQGGASAGRYIVTTLPSWAHSNAASDWRESMSGCGGEGVRSQSSRAVGQHCGLVQMEGNRATRVAGPRIDRPPLRGR
jgi:hypothetical protein